VTQASKARPSQKSGKRKSLGQVKSRKGAEPVCSAERPSDKDEVDANDAEQGKFTRMNFDSLFFGSELVDESVLEASVAGNDLIHAWCVVKAPGPRRAKRKLSRGAYIEFRASALKSFFSWPESR
jgi:hypothetical protein